MKSQTPDWFFQPTDVILYDPAGSHPTRNKPLKPFDEAIWAEALNFQKNGATILEPFHEEAFASLRETIEPLAGLLENFHDLVPRLDETIQQELTQLRPTFSRLADQVNRELVLLRKINPMLRGRYGFPCDPLPFDPNRKKRRYRSLISKISRIHRKTYKLVGELTERYTGCGYNPFPGYFYDLHPIFQDRDPNDGYRNYLTTEDPFSFTSWRWACSPGLPDFPVGHDHPISLSDLNRIIELPSGRFLYLFRRTFIEMDRVPKIRGLYREIESVRSEIRKKHGEIMHLERSLERPLSEARQRSLERTEREAATNRENNLNERKRTELDIAESNEALFEQHVKAIESEASGRLADLQRELESLCQPNSITDESKPV